MAQETVAGYMGLMAERDAWKHSSEVLQKALTSQIEQNAQLVDTMRRLYNLMGTPIFVSPTSYAKVFDPSGHDVTPPFPEPPNLEENLAQVILEDLSSLPEKDRRSFLASVIKSIRQRESPASG